MIGVALKTPLEIRLGIYIYKTSFLHRPDDYIGFTTSCPHHILQQNCAMQRPTNVLAQLALHTTQQRLTDCPDRLTRSSVQQARN